VPEWTSRKPLCGGGGLETAATRARRLSFDAGIAELGRTSSGRGGRATHAETRAVRAAAAKAVAPRVQLDAGSEH